MYRKSKNKRISEFRLILPDKTSHLIHPHWLSQSLFDEIKDIKLDDSTLGDLLDDGQVKIKIGRHDVKPSMDTQKVLHNYKLFLTVEVHIEYSHSEH